MAGLSGGAAALTAYISVRDMAFAETEKHLKGVLDNLPKATARHPKKNKYVHHLRVETRKAASALDLYADFFPAKRKSRLEKQLKKLRRAAGKARDLDVFIDLLEKDKTGQNSGALLKIAHKRRDKVQGDMVQAGKKAKDAGLRKEVRNLLKAAGQSRNGGMRFAPWARIELRPRASAFFASAPSSGASLDRLHDFRIEAKKLRYTMEMLQSAFPLGFAKELLPRVQDIQDRIGELVDIRARKKRLAKWLARAKDEAAAHELREHIALDASRLAQARADFSAWFTPAFLQLLKRDFDAQLAELTLVVPAGSRRSPSRNPGRRAAVVPL